MSVTAYSISINSGCHQVSSVALSLCIHSDLTSTYRLSVCPRVSVSVCVYIRPSSATTATCHNVQGHYAAVDGSHSSADCKGPCRGLSLIFVQNRAYQGVKFLHVLYKLYWIYMTESTQKAQIGKMPHRHCFQAFFLCIRT